MPELPEVETSRRGIAPHILGKTFKAVEVREPRLRWPVSAEIGAVLPGQTLRSVERRGKYLLLGAETGTLILHLGMSGNLRITAPDQLPGKHDHVDFVFADDTVLRFNDQRKFGAALWTSADPLQHPLLAELGPEPLSAEFDAAYLQRRAGQRSACIKSLIMDSHIVVGVGNIYASESLFLAGVLPTRAAGSLQTTEFERLAAAIKTILGKAIEQGGTTLRDFTNAEGKPGYFKQALAVYGRGGEPCRTCAEPVRHLKIGQRASYYCGRCQR
ncbi:bifunctional DNA-formamidopyrimidine glycosylase/DNA-(apurinic or apyrimidinic site) lyase [Methylomonas koyamae]|uniref:bifunctional DNA-formamidopyrimidine glycosylase/DNA-(apurinic or apyrimidinic site) lyase n=1 Tax=Methylomonas koyamae TaxID=702114 RepID=UPI002872E33B|nr:bifunctional DNA-formamidopyrimidine glycosylase/DNA-(apurinic or apyrimidinic site) lyase [Methylomonas koyamae]WNB74938.1 bifunctional DNA-formamidopyrimidine glycosylase/DNA-(apurinic or apyrimidinic site) lyase [Methylomonas koyamae]